MRSSLSRIALAIVTAAGVSVSACDATAPAAAPGSAPATESAAPATQPGVQLSALAPANVAKSRPAAPFDLTGNWFIDTTESADAWRFGPPYPKLTPAAQVHFDASQKAAREGKVYRDDIGQCWPAGLPLIMTRYWPMAMVQIPTAIYMVSGFMNSLRIVYLDGRSHPSASIQYLAGHSIGHWEGNALVIHTKYFETNQHWIDTGIPISDQFEMTERVTLLDKGMTLQIEYTMTDPKNWKGEWKSTKLWMREDSTDVPEVECLPNLNENLPSTEKGHAAVEAREKAREEGKPAATPAPSPAKAPPSK